MTTRTDSPSPKVLGFFVATICRFRGAITFSHSFYSYGTPTALLRPKNHRESAATPMDHHPPSGGVVLHRSNRSGQKKHSHVAIGVNPRQPSQNNPPTAQPLNPRQSATVYIVNTWRGHSQILLRQYPAGRIHNRPVRTGVQMANRLKIIRSADFLCTTHAPGLTP
jgi:hypothetical protein